MATTYTIFRDNGDESLTALGQAEANSPQGALRAWVNGEGAENTPREFAVIATSHIHTVSVKVETRTQLTIT